MAVFEHMEFARKARAAYTNNTYYVQTLLRRLRKPYAPGGTLAHAQHISACHLCIILAAMHDCCMLWLNLGCVCVLFPLFPPLAAGLRWRQPPCLLLHAGRPTPFAVLAVRARRQAWTCAVGFVGSPVDVVAHGPQPARVANWTHVDSGRHVIAGAEANDWPWMEWATELSPKQRELLHGGTVTACGVSARPIFSKPGTTGPVRDAQCTITLALTGEVARTVYAHPARMTRRTSLAKHPTRIA